MEVRALDFLPIRRLLMGVVKAPSCLKVRLARFVLRRVLKEKSLGDTKDS